MLFVKSSRKTEISQLDVAATIKEDVVGLDVTLECQYRVLLAVP